MICLQSTVHALLNFTIIYQKYLSAILLSNTLPYFTILYHTLPYFTLPTYLVAYILPGRAGTILLSIVVNMSDLPLVQHPDSIPRHKYEYEYKRAGYITCILDTLVQNSP